MKYLILILLLCRSLFMIGQPNMIPNPSFESYYDCDYNLNSNSLNTVIGAWSAVKSTPRYFNLDCLEDPNSDYYQFKNFSDPQDGNAYVALLFNRTFVQTRNYLQVETIGKIEKGKAYYLSYYMTLPYEVATPLSDYGVYLSDSLIEDDVAFQIPYGQMFLDPQIEIDSIPNLVFTEEGSWQKFSHCFIAEEDYTVLTFGIFEENDSIQGIDDIKYSHTFYAYDNMFLAAIDTVPSLNPYQDTICAGDCIMLSSNQSLVAYEFEWNLPGSDLGSSTAAEVMVCYDVPGIYDISLEVEHCAGRYERSFEKAVTVVEAVEMIPLENKVICEGSEASVSIGTDYTVLWEDGTNERNKSFDQADIYNYTISNGHCEETWNFELSYHAQAQYQEANIYACQGDESSFQGVIYDTPGMYYDTLYSDLGCDSLCYVIRFDYFETNPVVVKGPTGFCEEDFLELELTSPHIIQSWGDNTNDNPKKIDLEGQYILYTTDENHCHYIDTFHIEAYPLPYVITNDMMDVWYYDGLPLDVNYDGSIVGYSWSNGVYLDCDDCGYPSLAAPHEGFYRVTVLSEHGCKAEGQLEVRFKRADVYIPNAVGRSIEGEVNNYFFVQSDVELIYDLAIYDRWGGVLFDQKDLNSNNHIEGWLPDDAILPGVYVYKVTYSENGIVKILQGDITLF